MQKTLAVKLLGVSAAAIFICLVGTFAVVISQVRTRVEDMTLDQARKDAKATAASVASELNNLAGAVKFTAGAAERSDLTRAEITAMLPALVEKFNLVFGSWMTEQDKGFDGKQVAGPSEVDGTNKAGIFTPYWTRADNGLQLILPDNIDYSLSYFSLAAKTRAGAATEPYVEETAGGKLMMSIAYPVIAKDKLRGVLGVDVGLDALAGALSKERPFETGRVYLLSGQGAWLAAPDAKQIMKPYAFEDNDAARQGALKGEAQVLGGVIGADGLPVIRVVYPFDLPGLNARWIVVEDVPQAVVSAAVRQQTMVLVIGGIVIMAAVMLVLWLAVRQLIQRPVGTLLQDVSRMARGDFDTEVGNRQRSDEVGELAVSLEAFRHKLAEGRSLEAVAREQRVAAEEQRNMTEAERQAVSETQRQVVASLAKALKHLSDGNLAHRISERFPGSYEELRDHYNSAIDSLEQTVIRLNGTVETLTNGTREINHSSDLLSRRTEQQAASLEESTAALGEISSKLHESADNARQAAAKVKGARDEADASGVVVQQAISAMEDIEDSSRKVSQIIGVIDEIAFQTNLLALNAGVEAARAGEAGKGFAVVAMEVRELAQRSATAAKDIKALISASNSQVGQGVDLVSRTGTALGRIADQVQAIDHLMQQISRAADEQANGLREISSAVNQMDQMTQQNAAMVEETTAASSVLSDEAANLRVMVSQFVVGSGQQARRVA
ncbi:methyl-accepting chemotaxis protein [Rhizobium aquaticum]|uniref:Methyl-accepting chemotaxis protein n=1 Tax=Rhizobium aquaticum TaxID=1549636 RepID=A0ABV2IWN0_9HYPH